MFTEVRWSKDLLHHNPKNWSFHKLISNVKMEKFL